MSEDLENEKHAENSCLRQANQNEKDEVETLQRKHLFWESYFLLKLEHTSRGFFYLWECLMKLWKGFFIHERFFSIFRWRIWYHMSQGADECNLNDAKAFFTLTFCTLFFVISMEWSLCLRRFWKAQKSHDLCWHYAMQLSPKKQIWIDHLKCKKYQGQPFFFPIPGGEYIDVTMSPLSRGRPLNFLRLVEKICCQRKILGGYCPSRGVWLVDSFAEVLDP